MFRKIGELIIRVFSKNDSPRIPETILKRYLLAAYVLIIPGLSLFFIMSAAGQTVEYPVGPGDTLYISIWGQENLSGPTVVGPDGTIALPPPVGSIYVNQLTANEIAGLLTEKLSEYVKQPVVMVSIREFQGFIVHILGQINLPGFYRIPEGTSIQELITQAQGLTKFADPTCIMLIRKKAEKVEKREIDFSRFLKDSDMDSNPVLKTNDVVLVPRADIQETIQQLVTVIGRVSSPGTYDLEVSMPLLDVLTLAGGVLAGADLRNVFILSRSKKGAEASRQVDLEALLAGKENQHVLGAVVSPGEIVFIPDTDLLEPHAFPVSVIGRVTSPGIYQLAEGGRVMDAIFKAGGFAEDASIDNLGIIHANRDDSVVSRFSLKEYLVTGNVAANPALSEGDTLIVPMLEGTRVIPPLQTAFVSTINVSIIGAVAKSGAYQLSAKSNLLDVLTLAGGPTSSADLERTVIIRGENAPLQEGEQRFGVDLKTVMTEGNLDPLPVMFSGDTVFVPKLKEKEQSLWRSIIQVAGDITTLIVLYYLVVGKIYRR